MFLSYKTSMQLNSDFQPIHQRALHAAEGFRRAEAELLEALGLVDQKKVFLALGYSSLFVYATQALKLPEAVAYNAITVMRKAQEVPELKKHIASGELSLSKARKVVAVLKPENQTAWIAKAIHLTARSLEKEVAKENPREATPEKAKYVSSERLQVNLGLQEEAMLKLRRAQDLVSGSLGKPATLEETLEVISNFYLQHKDPVQKAKRVIAKKGLQEASQKGIPSQQNKKIDSPAETRRTEIPAVLQHAVRFRDQGRCQFKRSSEGAICGEKRWVELHHVKPVAQGGEHSVQNLVTLCNNHHGYFHAAQIQNTEDMTQVL
jgi:5-methylcytosine-specific restriction endonuclease McrA